GGAIEATNSIIRAYNVDFVVKGGFDTGGAIKFEKSGQKLDHNVIKDSTFKLVGGQLLRSRKRQHTSERRAAPSCRRTPT
ncbi:hypothetical protein, partial [Suipraeoptans intestinalis]|uniref:hypothetical protein n=1 Tax=Suipraeoptans intestinalis TaxID=2606628 RepID=UPI0015664075